MAIKLLELAKKIFGSKKVSQQMGTKTGVKLLSSGKNDPFKGIYNVEMLKNNPKALAEAKKQLENNLGYAFSNKNTLELQRFEKNLEAVDAAMNPKSADVIPIKKKEGIETLSEADQDVASIQKTIDDLDETVKEADAFSESIGFPKNPNRLGGALDPITGVTRTLARKILDKKGIKIDRLDDPIDVFENTIGFDVLTDVRNLADDIVEAENIGRRLKPMDELLEMEGLFDVKIPKNPVKGITNEELNKELISQVGKEFKLDVEKFAIEFSVSTEEAIRISKLPSTEQQKILQKYIDQDLKQRIELSEFKIDPDRKPNADGGLIDILTL